MKNQEKIEMMSKAKIYTEVLEIINNLSEDDYNKIPIEKINYYKDNMDKSYIYTINPENDLSKQNISREANAIIVGLYRDYFVTEEQKKVIDEILELNEKKLEQDKVEKFNSNTIFENSQNINTDNNDFKIELNNNLEKNNNSSVEDNSNNFKNTGLVVQKNSIFEKIKKFFIKLKKRFL